LPARFAKIASLAPTFAASASATTFSAYDVDFTPARTPRSLRGHGTRAIAVAGGAGSIGAATTTRVGPESPLGEPSGASPPV
jgi:hypothetical protein